MSIKYQRGSSGLEDLLILVGLLVIIFFFVIPGETPNLLNYGGDAPGLPDAAGERKEEGRRSSAYSRVVTLGRGNASSAYQPYEEYITISNHSGVPVDITGWRLANAKDERPYDYAGLLKNLPRDEAAIPQAAPFVGSSATSNVILQPGETAIVTTGSLGSRSPYVITSFKENMCSGYLDSMDEYAFTPSLSRNCPSPADEPGVSSLPADCRDFVKRLPSCSIPKFDAKDRSGETCTTCVNGERLSSACYAFVKERFNYGSCTALHRSDPKFSGRTWRIFLGRGWEMWAADYETIKLYDRLGNLVDSINY